MTQNDLVVVVSMLPRTGDDAWDCNRGGGSPNDRVGATQFDCMLRKHSSARRVMEASGATSVSGQGVRQTALECELSIETGSQLRESAGRLAKNDRIDAEMIRLVARHQRGAKPGQDPAHEDSRPGEGTQKPDRSRNSSGNAEGT